MRHMKLGTALAGPMLALILFGAAACGESSDEGVASVAAGASAAAPTPSASADLTAFTKCMRDNGVEISDPDPNTGMPDMSAAQGDSAKFREAMQKCRDKLPNGGQRGTLDQAQQEQLRVFAQCMRDHGVDMPDPDPNSGGFGFGNGGTTIDRNSPTFQKAMEACQDKLTGIFPSMGAR